MTMGERTIDWHGRRGKRRLVSVSVAVFLRCDVMRFGGRRSWRSFRIDITSLMNCNAVPPRQPLLNYLRWKMCEHSSLLFVSPFTFQIFHSSHTISSQLDPGGREKRRKWKIINWKIKSFSFSPSARVGFRGKEKKREKGAETVQESRSWATWEKKFALCDFLSRRGTHKLKLLIIF